MHSEGDQIVPIADSVPLAAELLKNDALKAYRGLPHDTPTTHREIINPNLPAFVQARSRSFRLLQTTGEGVRLGAPEA
jgi:non-heme chloroperoxidase